MNHFQATLARAHKADVGEGPVWNSLTLELVWLDVTGGEIFFYHPETNQQEAFSLDQHIGAIALTDSNEYILAIRDGFALFNRASGAYTYLAQVLDSEDVRFNDGKIDPRGRFVAGTMKYEASPGTASLYSIEKDGKVRTLLSSVGLSNGLCWNQQGTTLYYIDTLTHSIHEFEYDCDSGNLGAMKVLITFDASHGNPDGMTIDRDGNLWVAMWAGAKVLNISKSGEIIGEISLPVDLVTSVAFGGHDLGTLYITTARYQLSDEVLQEQPLAGSLFKAAVGAYGLSENRYALADAESGKHV